MTCGTVVNMAMWSDADFAMAYQWLVDDVPYDFSGQQLMMRIRRFADDTEVFVALDSKLLGGVYGGIMFNEPVGDFPGRVETFNIFILRKQTEQMAAGDYVQSLILVRPDGLREEIWQGIFTYTIGPTR
jgi:hypothetical protein